MELEEIRMRLWHKNLIEALPREQLVAQWRECSAIAGNIQTKGTPNHILVNKVLDYDFDHFITYSKMVKLSQEERKSFNEIMCKIQKSGCVHYTIPKKNIGRSSVHTVPNRIG